MDQKSLKELYELKNKYAIKFNGNDKLPIVIDKGTKSVVKLEKEDIYKLVFAYSWENAWRESGMREFDKIAFGQGDYGNNNVGLNVLNKLIDVVADTTKKSPDFNIDKITEAFENHSHKYARSAVHHLLQPNRLDCNLAFGDLYLPNPKLTSDLAKNDPMLYLTLSQLIKYAKQVTPTQMGE